MIARPNDLDLAFEYAKLSSEAGDYEGAISTLERMLIYAPSTPRLQLELGVLYYKIGAYDVARNYFEQALANRNVPPEVAQQIKLYLQQLSLTADPPPFSATIFSAIRWESNANSGQALRASRSTASTSPSTSRPWVRLGGARSTSARCITSSIWSKATESSSIPSLTRPPISRTASRMSSPWAPSFNMRRFEMDKTRAYVYAIGDLAWLGLDPYFQALRRGRPLAELRGTAERA